VRTGIREETAQAAAWKGRFGQEYTDRNAVHLEEMDALYQKKYGVTKTELNRRFLGDAPRDARILEVGCNVGNQLLLLQKMGYQNLYGVEIQSYALELARKGTQGINLIQAYAMGIPFKDRYFDLVFTHGLLIHIAPAGLPAVMDEIHRCARTWVWGLEYYASQLTEVSYRRQENLLWKTDYAGVYRNRLAGLELVREERLRSADSAFAARISQARPSSVAKPETAERNGLHWGVWFR
jgi:pseudaminic acid biosynthesis-associated methylase